MSLVKRYMEEVWERGWSSVDHQVCVACVTDPVLAAVVATCVDSPQCDYCGTTSDTTPIAAPVDALLELIVPGLRSEYEDPIEHVAWSGSDGGYQVETFDTYDLLQDMEVTENGDLLTDLSLAIETLWCQRHPYLPAPHQALIWGWEGFRQHVMHRRRYTFLLPEASAQQRRDWGEIPPEDMPKALAQAIEDGGLAVVLPAGATFYRARVHSPDERPTSAKDLGPPPPTIAKTNRMTPAGISGFYGASTIECALAEVRGYADEGACATVGAFVTSRPMPVINLINLPTVPSLFDEHRRHLRAAVRFLRNFATDVARLADPDDQQHLEYVPTQVVAEYLREQFPHPSGSVIGVLWRSSKDPSATCCVLFTDNAGCVDEDIGWQQNPDTALALKAGSVQCFGPPI